MSFPTSIHRRNYHHDLSTEQRNPSQDIHESDEEFEETEDDLIGNYLYLTQHCGVLRHSPTTSVLDTFQHHHHNHPSNLLRQFSLDTENSHENFERSIAPTRTSSCLNDFNNNNTTISRVPPTIYYNGQDDADRSFSLVKLFARMKARLNHDRRYRPRSNHELLHEDDTPDWFELTKNIPTVLSNALLPDGGYDALINQQKANHHRRHSSKKKTRNADAILPKQLEDEENKIKLEFDEEWNGESDDNYDLIIWKKFLRCSRGFAYRRNAVCKAVDRQNYQGQLVYVYGIANNILIDENLKASGLG